MHVRIRLQRQARRHAGLEALARALHVLHDQRVQLERLPLAHRRAIRRQRRADVECQQRECLVVQQRAVIERRSVSGDQRAKQTIGPLVARHEVVERVPDEPRCIAAPAKRRRHREAIGLARIDARAARLDQRLAVLRQPLVESARRIDAARRPEWIGRIAQPAAQLAVLLIDARLVVHDRSTTAQCPAVAAAVPCS